MRCEDSPCVQLRMKHEQEHEQKHEHQLEHEKNNEAAAPLRESG